MKLPTPGRVLWELTYPGHLYPLNRPRFAQGRVYQPLENQRAFREWLKSERPDIPYSGPVWIDCFFCFKTNREADNDNLLKAVYDGLQAKSIRFIENDKKILGGSHARMHGAVTPSTTIVIREVIFYDAPPLSAAGS